MNKETVIQNRCMIAIGCRPDALVLRLHVGKYRPIHDPKQVVSIGEPGWPDTLVLVKTRITEDMLGKEICVAAAGEIKTPVGRQAEVQRNWQAAFEKRAGIYRLVRSPEEMVQLVEDVANGRW